MPQKRYLVVKLAALGDVLVASTVVQRLRAEQPGCHITWLCGRGAAPLVHLLDVDEVLEVDERALLSGGAVARGRALLVVWRRLLFHRFDHVLLLHPDPRYRLLLPPVRRWRMTQLSRKHPGRMNPIPGRFLGDEYARALDAPTNAGPILTRYDVADVRARLPAAARSAAVAARPAGTLVALVPGGARNAMRDDPLRRWPAASYAIVAAELLRDGHSVAIIGGPDDDWVRPAFAGVAVQDLIGRFSVVESLAFLAECDAVVSHDTGPLHMARAVRVPTVALFGPTPPHLLIGPNGAARVLWGGEHLPCRPCYDGREFAACADNQCIKSITVPEVLGAVRELLAATAAQNL